MTCRQPWKHGSQHHAQQKALCCLYAQVVGSYLHAICSCAHGTLCAQGASDAAPLLTGREDAALRQLCGSEATIATGCSGREVLAWALEQDRWLQDGRVRACLLICCLCI